MPPVLSAVNASSRREGDDEMALSIAPPDWSIAMLRADSLSHAEAAGAMPAMMFLAAV